MQHHQPAPPLQAVTSHHAAPSPLVGARRERNNNKHKRLFLGEEGGLVDGAHLVYKASPTGAVLLEGIAVIDPKGASGIRCSCCSGVVSCSQFEAHAGGKLGPGGGGGAESGHTLQQACSNGACLESLARRERHLCPLGFGGLVNMLCGVCRCRAGL